MKGRGEPGDEVRFEPYELQAATPLDGPPKVFESVWAQVAKRANSRSKSATFAGEPLEVRFGSTGQSIKVEVIGGQ